MRRCNRSRQLMPTTASMIVGNRSTDNHNDERRGPHRRLALLVLCSQCTPGIGVRAYGHAPSLGSRRSAPAAFARRASAPTFSSWDTFAETSVYEDCTHLLCYHDQPLTQ